MQIKRVGLITRDCSGINACIRAVVRSAAQFDIEIYGILRGFAGLMENEILPLNTRSVSGILSQGGTILKTARAKEFMTEKGRKKALATIKKNRLDALVVAGGNGSLTGAYTLFDKYSVPVIGIPATIDNDVNGTEITIGSDTAVNVAMDAIDKIRDTATSLERIFVIEVMGRDCGYIALESAIAGGCENVIVPEMEFSIAAICKAISAGNRRGKRSWIVVVAEGKARAHDVADEITRRTGLETRETVLGHIQRGGRPTAFDRILAARFGTLAVSLIAKRTFGVMTVLRKGVITTAPLESVLKPRKIDADEYYRILGNLDIMHAIKPSIAFELIDGKH